MLIKDDHVIECVQKNHPMCLNYNIFLFQGTVFMKSEIKL